MQNVLPFSVDEEARISSLRSLGILDTPEEERFDRITRLASSIFEVPIAYIAMVDVNRQWFKSRVGLTFCETSRDDSFCTYTILHDTGMIIHDALEDDRFCDNPMVKGEPFVRFYAGHPLRGPESQIVGTLCIMDHEPRDFSREQIRLLKELCQLAERELELVDALENRNRVIQLQNDLLDSQKRLQSELRTAFTYIETLLPSHGETLNGIRCDWIFQPSQEVGGDCFAFHKLDEHNIAIYVIDVCDHGVGAALLSVTLLHLLRSQGFWKIDFTNPAKVLTSLNDLFNRKNLAQTFFTTWYGVYNLQTQQLAYSNGGHPPAILIPSDPSQPPSRLHVPGVAISCTPDAVYTNKYCQISPGDTLWIFSDGAFEYKRADGDRQNLDAWIQSLTAFTQSNQESLEPVQKELERLHGRSSFEDDVCVVRLRFPTSPQ